MPTELGGDGDRFFEVCALKNDNTADDVLVSAKGPSETRISLWRTRTLVVATGRNRAPTLSREADRLLVGLKVLRARGIGFVVAVQEDVLHESHSSGAGRDLFDETGRQSVPAGSCCETQIPHWGNQAVCHPEAAYPAP
jgi:hypothetical protein